MWRRYDTCHLHLSSIITALKKELHKKLLICLRSAPSRHRRSRCPQVPKFGDWRASAFLPAPQCNTALFGHVVSLSHCLSSNISSPTKCRPAPPSGCRNAQPLPSGRRLHDHSAPMGVLSNVVDELYKVGIYRREPHYLEAQPGPDTHRLSLRLAEPGSGREGQAMRPSQARAGDVFCLKQFLEYLSSLE